MASKRMLIVACPFPEDPNDIEQTRLVNLMTKWRNLSKASKRVKDTLTIVTAKDPNDVIAAIDDIIMNIDEGVIGE